MFSDPPEAGILQAGAIMQMQQEAAIASVGIRYDDAWAVRPCVRVEIYHGGVQLMDQPDYAPVDAFVQAVRSAVPELTHYKTAKIQKDRWADDAAWTAVASFTNTGRDMRHFWVYYQSAPSPDTPVATFEILVNMERPRFTAKQVAEVVARIKAHAVRESPWYVGGYKSWITLTLPIDHPLVVSGELRTWLFAQPLLRDGSCLVAVCGPGVVGDAEGALRDPETLQLVAPNPIIQRPALRPRVNDALATLLCADPATGLAYPVIPRVEWLTFIRTESLIAPGMSSAWRDELRAQAEVKVHELSSNMVCVEAGGLFDLPLWSASDTWMPARRHVARTLRPIRVAQLTPGAVVGVAYGASQWWLDVFDTDQPAVAP